MIEFLLNSKINKVKIENQNVFVQYYKNCITTQYSNSNLCNNLWGACKDLLEFDFKEMEARDDLD